MGACLAAGKRVGRRALSIAALTAPILLTLSVGSALAQQDIISSGPLNNILLTDDLGCQVTHVGDTSPEFYGGFTPGACGTFFNTGGVTYGPSVPGGSSLSDFNSPGPNILTGSGTVSNPYQVTSVVDVPFTGLNITQVDSYVVGQEQYRTDITVQNPFNSTVAGTLYHAGDCYLQGDDSGYGWVDTANQGAYCAANPNDSPAGSVMGFQPLTAGSSFVEGYYATVWGDTALGGPYSNTCDCTTFEDNGAGLSWPVILGPSSSRTFSFLTTVALVAGASTPTPTPTPGQPTGTPSAPGGQPGQPSGTPALGQSFNAVPVSGQVLVKLPGSGFAPLSQTRLLPTGTQVDTLSGTVELVSATGNKANTLQNGTFNGAIFSVGQAHSGRNKGLVTLKLLDGSCKAPKTAAGPLAQAAVSGSVLSTLHSHSHGKYSSSGHYGSATSRGTAWTITDRCNSTLISDQQDTVLVHDFVHHRTLTLHAGQHYLITAKR